LAAGNTKIVGANSTGVETFQVNADSSGNLLVKSYSSGSSTGGAAAPVSDLSGGLYRASLPTLTDGQQSAVQLDSSGRLIIAPLTNASIVKAQLQDNAGSGITSTLINSKQRLDISAASDGTAGSAVPFQTTQVGGSDGTNLRAIAVDTSGRQVLAASSYFHPIFSLRTQAVAGNTGSATTSLVIPITSTASGSLIAVAVSSSTAATISVTDNLAQSYSTAVSGTSGTHTSYVFYKANSAAGVTSITVSATINSGMTAVVTEYFGISSTPLDKTSTGNVTGTTAFSSGSTAATTSAVELLFGSAHGVTKNNGTYTPGTGWASVGTANGFNPGAGQLYVEDQYVSATGTYAATGTASANDTIIANIATFVVTNTNLMSLNQPKLVKSGAGILRRIVVNTVGTGSPILTVYDGTTASSSAVVASLSLLSIGSVEYNLNFAAGLTISVNSSTSDFTLVYE
jgi:hypothetical protein